MPLRKATPKHDIASKLSHEPSSLPFPSSNTGPDNPTAAEEPVAGWWADTDWFQNLIPAEIDAKLGSLPAEQDWVVLPVDYVDSLRSYAEANRNAVMSSAPGYAVEHVARELLLVMVQRTGFSTNHAQNAWDMAAAYEKERVKRTTTQGGVQ